MPSFQVANLIRDRKLLETAKREAVAVLAGEEVSSEETDRAIQHMRSRWHKAYGLVEVG
jgi:ATP-dependent DNA helicase RecG